MKDTDMIAPRRLQRRVARLASCLLLSACGGGGVPDFTQAYSPAPPDVGSSATLAVVAGSGQVGRADGNAASPRATFNLPLGLATDAAGNLYVADSGNHRIRRVSTGGSTVTFAGSGARGFADASGAAASFDTPSAVTVDASGNVLVADTGNNALRSISPTGVVTTVSTAPLTLSAPLALAADASGTVYVADSGHGRIVRLRPFEPATEIASGLDQPAGLTLDSAGALYIADTARHVIRRYADGVLSLYAGTEDSQGQFDNVDDPSSPAQFNRPTGLAALPDGRIYVADTGNNALRIIDAAGLVNPYFNFTVSFSQPAGITADRVGNVLISDTNANRILRLAPTTILTTLAGSGTTGSLAVGDGGTVYVADTAANVIRKSSGGVTSVLAGSGVPGDANGTGLAAQFNGPTSVVSAPGGILYVADGSNQIRQVTAEGVVTVFARTLETISGGGSTYSINPVGLHVRADGQLFATSNSPNAILRVDVKPGKVIAGYDGEPRRVGDETRYDNGAGAVDPDRAVPFYGLTSLAVDMQGNAYVVDTGANSVRVYLPGSGVNGTGGLVVTLAGTPDQRAGYSDGTGAAAAFNQPRGLLLDGDGNLYVADSGNNAVRKIVVDRSGDYPVGIVSTVAGALLPGKDDGAGSAASFNNPQGLAFDASGNVLVLDGNNNLIRRIAVDGQVSAVAALGVLGQVDGVGGAPSFSNPAGLTVSADGTIYVADTDNNEIRGVRADGNISTIAGSGVEGSQDGRGASAGFNNPNGVSVDAAGVLYVADTLNHRIRRIAPDGTTQTIAGSGAAGFADGIGAAAVFNNPTSLSVTADGALIVVADRENQRIRRMTKSANGSWTVSTLAGSGLPGSADGMGAAATFSSPIGVALEANGDAVVADTANNRIRRVSAAGVVSTVAGSGEAGKADGASAVATFNRPQGIAVDGAGRIVVADTLNNLVRRITADGTVSRVAGVGPPYFVNGQVVTGLLTPAVSPFYYPTAVSVGTDGAIYVANANYHQIAKILP